MEVLLASRNPNKTREFGELLGGEFELLDLTGEADPPEIAETGKTFEENAIIKAKTISASRPHRLVVADDSGLIVEALNGEPGIFSARFARPGATDEENIAKLLHELERKPQSDRSARFYCAIAICRGGNLLQMVSGEVAGKIAFAARGENGFGYDPLFIPQGFNETLAELSGEVKNRISHRARAVEKLRPFLVGC